MSRRRSSSWCNRCRRAIPSTSAVAGVRVTRIIARRARQASAAGEIRPPADRCRSIKWQGRLSFRRCPWESCRWSEMWPERLPGGGKRPDAADGDDDDRSVTRWQRPSRTTPNPEIKPPTERARRRGLRRRRRWPLPRLRQVADQFRRPPGSAGSRNPPPADGLIAFSRYATAASAPRAPSSGSSGAQGSRSGCRTAGVPVPSLSVPAETVGRLVVRALDVGRRTRHLRGPDAW